MRQRRTFLLLLAALPAFFGTAAQDSGGDIDLERRAGTDKSLRALRHGTTPTDKSASRHGTTTSLESSTSRALITGEPDLFVRTTEECHERWASWPVIQEEGLATGNVLLFRVFNSIGNLFIVMEHIVQLAMMLEVAVVLDCEKFPGFRVAFDPATIKWDVDPTVIMQLLDRAANQDPNARFHQHVLKYRDGLLLLSDSRLLLLATKLNLVGASLSETVTAVRGADFPNLRNLAPVVIEGSLQPDPCAWNLFLRRSPSMIQSMVAQSPWVAADGVPQDDVHPTKYVAWHIRTSDGETMHSFNPERHRYIFHGQSSESVFPVFLAATKGGEDQCPSAFPGGEHDTPIYISSNSKEMARNCSSGVAEQGVVPGLIDLGLVGNDGHTAYSKNPTAAAVGAFIDYLYLMDADIIVRSGSSFSGTVVKIKGMGCRQALPGVGVSASGPGLVVCLPSSCL